MIKMNEKLTSSLEGENSRTQIGFNTLHEFHKVSNCIFVPFKDTLVGI